MSSSSSASSDDEVRSPKKSTGQPQKGSSSDSDFVDSKKPSAKSNPILTKLKPNQDFRQSTSKDLLSSKLQFQKMLMGSNNRLAELQKNKQNIAKSGASPSPIRGILKSKALEAAEVKKKSPKKRKSDESGFNPVASSTQFPLVSPDKSIRKQRTLSDSSSDDDDDGRQVVKKTVSDSSSSEDEQKNRKEAAKKEKRRQRSDSSQSSDSSESRNGHKRKREVDRKIGKSQVESSSDEDTKKSRDKIKKKLKKESISDSESSSSDVEDKHKKSKDKKSKMKQQKQAESSSDSEQVTKLTEQIKRKRTLSQTSKPRESSSDDDSSTSNSSNVQKSDVKSKKQKRSSDSYSDSHQISKAVKQLKKFEADNTSLTSVDEKHDLFHSLSTNDEIFLVQIPKSLDPKLLINTTISLSKKTRVPEKSRKYDCVPSYETRDPIAIFTNAEKISLVKTEGNLKMQRHIKSKHLPNINGPSDNKVAFPNDLKQRHPLFGAEYSEKISLEKNIEEKLKAAVESYGKKKKKKKHKKSKDHEEAAPKEEEEEIFKFLSQTDVPRNEKSNSDEIKVKKKKKSHSNSFEDFQTSAEDLDLTSKKKKHKKEKKDEVDLSEIVEKQDFENKKRKKSKKSKDDAQDDDTKKEKSLDNTQDNALELINEMLFSKSCEILSPVKSKKEKKKKKRARSSSISEDGVDVSGDVEKRKKKKHKKHKSHHE